MDTRLIRRLVYDENFERAFVLLLDIIENQEKRIQELEQSQQNNEDN